jgi:hypothetical protein
MNEKKNIDRLFQEKFKDFEVAPQDAVWNRINESLPNKKKKRRVIPIWWQVGGVAATIALLLTIGVSVFNSESPSSTEKGTIVDTEHKNSGETETNSNKNTSDKDEQKQLNNAVEFNKLELVNSDKTEETFDGNDIKESRSKKNTTGHELISPNAPNAKVVVNSNNKTTDKSSNLNKQKRLTKTSNEDKTTTLSTNTKSSELKDSNLTNEQKLKSVLKDVTKENNTAVADNTSSKSSESTNTNTTDINENNSDIDKSTELTNDIVKESIKDAIAAQESINEEEKEDEVNRWSVAPNVAPVYFASLGEGSPIHNQFNGNAKSSDINMSYGISGSYAVSKKLKVRAGVNRVNLNYATSDVFAFSESQTASRSAEAQGNIAFKEGSAISIVSSTVLNRSSTPELFNAKITGDLDQRFGFIEVPLELEYCLLDKKFGINVIGGFSTFFLNENEIFADINGTTTLIGEADNINSTSFSANFGLGFNYNLSKQWNINLEPQFKYQINTFNDTFGDFRPFFIGVYTGLSFKF